MMIPQLKYCYKASDAGQIIEESYIEQKAIAGYCFQNIVFNQITFVKPLVFESCYFENCTFNYCDINSLILRITPSPTTLPPSLVISFLIILIVLPVAYISSTI